MERQVDPFDGIDSNNLAEWLERAERPSQCCADASGTSIARKTRQRSASSAGTVADLELDPPGAAQHHLAIIDELL